MIPQMRAPAERSYHQVSYQQQQYGYDYSKMMHQNLNNESRKKRNRKNPNQMQYLMQEYSKDPNWTKETCCRVSKATGLTESQVYKWGWDQKNKKAEDGHVMM